MRKSSIWYLVADGSQARFVRETPSNRESGERREDLVFEAVHKKLQQIMADRPGRSYSSHDARRSAMEYHSDPVVEQQQRFAEFLIGEFETHHAAGSVDKLIIVAEPHMLGLLRKALPESLKSVVIGEFALDLTNLPESKLYAAIDRLEVPAV